LLVAALLRDVAPARSRALLFGSGAVAFALACLLAWLPPRKEALVDLPMDGITVIESRALPERVATLFPWGGTFMYRFGTSRDVFIDGRNLLYNNGVFHDYLRLTGAAADALPLLDIYAVNTVLWPVNWDLDVELRAHPDVWRHVFRDEHSVVYVRRAAERPLQ
jgi:hypothetical protein